MIDANILVSAYLKPISLTAEVFDHIKANHTIVLCSYIN